jgi:hypothetical protein
VIILFSILLHFSDLQNTSALPVRSPHAVQRHACVGLYNCRCPHSHRTPDHLKWPTYIKQLAPPWGVLICNMRRGGRDMFAKPLPALLWSNGPSAPPQAAYVTYREAPPLCICTPRLRAVLCTSLVTMCTTLLEHPQARRFFRMTRNKQRSFRNNTDRLTFVM